MKIEEIKKRLADGTYIYYVGEVYQDYSESADHEVEYLLSIIEQAEKALEDIKHISSPRIDDYTINQLARHALKAIREG